MDTEHCELGTGLQEICVILTQGHSFSSCNTYQKSACLPHKSKHHKTTLKIIRNIFFLSWMTVNVTPKPSRRLSQRDECSHTNLESRLGEPHTIDFSSIYKGFSNGFNGTKYTVACSALCVHVCMSLWERERERINIERLRPWQKFRDTMGYKEKGGLDKGN